MDADEVLVINQIMNDVIVAEEQADNAVRRKFFNRENAFNLSDVQFIKLFRLTKDLTRNLIEMLSPFIDPPSRLSAVSIETKILVALLFYGHGSYQQITGKNIFAGLSQPSVSRCIKQVTDALNREEIMNQWIKFHRNLQELQTARSRFYRKYHFPGIVGCIDCTHVAIVRPYEDEHIYVNRKNYHSINVQLICDEYLTILNVNSRFPGSCHDAYIWRQSNVSELMESIYRRDNNNSFFLLGDAGYPLRPWLLTPLQNPLPNSPDERMNNTLKSIRSIIERCNGVLKNRFRCLLKHRVLHYSPHTASKIINACVVLHNMCIVNNIEVPEMDDEVLQADFGMHVNDIYVDEPMARVNADLEAARRLQRHIITNHFN